MDFCSILSLSATQLGITLSAGQLDLFNRYYLMLLEWNEKINLTAITSPEDVAIKHMIDSLSCHDSYFFPPDCSVVDIGTGAGFPGIPLKIIRPDIQLTLLDSLNKRLLFLHALALALNLENVRMVHQRAEDAGRIKEHREKYTVAVSRAVARLNVLVELCLPAVAPGGHFIALKGAQYQQEIAEAGQAIKLLGGEISEVRPVKLPGLDDSRAVIYINKKAATPSAYPRRPGMPEKKPL